MKARLHAQLCHSNTMPACMTALPLKFGRGHVRVLKMYSQQEEEEEEEVEEGGGK